MKKAIYSFFILLSLAFILSPVVYAQTPGDEVGSATDADKYSGGIPVGTINSTCDANNQAKLIVYWDANVNPNSKATCQVYLRKGDDPKSFAGSNKCSSTLTVLNNSNAYPDGVVYLSADSCQRYTLFIKIQVPGVGNQTRVLQSDLLTDNCQAGHLTNSTCEGRDYGIQTGIKSVFGRIVPPAFVGKIGDSNLGVSTFLTWVIRLIYIFAGIAFLFMIIFGAFQILTSGGDKEAVGGGRKKITYAIIGIVVLALAYLIVGVLGQLIGFGFFVGQPT